MNTYINKNKEALAAQAAEDSIAGGTTQASLISVTKSKAAATAIAYASAAAAASATATASVGAEILTPNPKRSAQIWDR